MARSPAARNSQTADSELRPNGAGEGGVFSVERPVPGSLVQSGADEPLPAVAPAHTDWLYHRLQISGPAAEASAFRKVAAGAGVIPWRLDLDRMEEDFFLRLAAPPPGHVRTLSIDGARLLAAELRDAVARRHALAVARVGESSACPFDLHALLPVPAKILQLGPDHPDALDWLWTHWGTAQGLRHVTAEAALGRRRLPSSAAAGFAVTFWSADWTPWRALATLRERWPSLCFAITPRYELA